MTGATVETIINDIENSALDQAKRFWMLAAKARAANAVPQAGLR